MSETEAAPQPAPAAEAPRNRLRESRSPYLQQHADNPVAWWQWSPEALAAARTADKPIFLSVGYSTCHWCHVMAHESFEDAEVGKVLNDAFICIKVDREERPDVDMTYMPVCHALTGGGGWPLTVIMTPDLQPFWAGTYLPKHGKFGRPGLLDLVPRVTALWKTRRDDVVQDAKQITEAIVAAEESGPATGEVKIDVLDAASARLESTFDEQFGGFGNAPKFPSPHVLGLLARADYHCRGSRRSREMAERTLEAMRRGGIYDHLGHGYHRYATDRAWAVPHFEKMLYDQAGIALALLDVAQLTGAERYREWAHEAFTYVMRDLAGVGDAAGAFYSAEDADSEGVEGKFYTWTLEQLRDVLGADRASAFAAVYNVPAHAEGEPPTLRLTADVPAAMKEEIAQCREELFAARCKRVRPHRDENVLADWNAFFAVALARGARVLGHKPYLDAARACLAFITTRMRNAETGHLYHHFNTGVAAVDGNLDDYAFTVWALCELHMATFDDALLHTARQLAEKMHELFWDAKSASGYVFTAAGSAPSGSLPRPKEVADGAMPSGNSAALAGLGLLGLLTSDDAISDRAAALVRALGTQASASPWAHAMFVTAALDRVANPWRVGVAARDVPTALKASQNLTPFFLPNAALHSEVSESFGDRAPEFRVCAPLECKPPVSTAEEVASMMSSCRKQPTFKF